MEAGNILSILTKLINLNKEKEEEYLKQLNKTVTKINENKSGIFLTSGVSNGITLTRELALEQLRYVN